MPRKLSTCSGAAQRSSPRWSKVCLLCCVTVFSDNSRLQGCQGTLEVQTYTLHVWLQASSQHWRCRCPGRQRRPSKCRMPHVGVAQRSQQGGLLHTGQAGGQPDLLSQLGTERLGNTSCRVSGGCTKARRRLLSAQGVHTVAPRAPIRHAPPSHPNPNPSPWRASCSAARTGFERERAWSTAAAGLDPAPAPRSSLAATGVSRQRPRYTCTRACKGVLVIIKVQAAAGGT